MRVDEVVKLGKPKQGPADAFIQDFLDISEPHPFNPRVGIIGGAAIELSKFNGNIHLSDITSLDPGKGYSNAAMRLLTRLADKHNVVIELIAKAYRNDRMDTEQLVQWYQRLGFQPVDDDLDLDYGVEMRYIP